MKEFKGTPGPWEIDECGDVCTKTGRLNGELGIVAGVAGAEWCSEDIANANLIAAAPNLLLVLQKVIESKHILPHLKIEAQWVIASALGEK